MKGSNCTDDNSNNTSTKSFLCNFGYVDYIVLASTIAIALSEELTSNDLNILASFFAVLSDELALVSAVEVCPSNDNGNNDNFVFVPPDVAMTSNNKKNKSKKRTIIKKKTIKKKIRKRKNT